MEYPIYFQNQGINYRLRGIRKCREWLNAIIEQEDCMLGEIYITFTSDEGLLEINKQYLDHHFYTDIITFPYQEEGQPIHSDIFISVDRAKDNAQTFGAKPTDEVHRLLAHGILHLVGYDDHSDEEKAEMRAQEDKYLSLRSDFGFGD
jgi:rRNA maturation RNase YbeY